MQNKKNKIYYYPFKRIKYICKRFNIEYLKEYPELFYNSGYKTRGISPIVIRDNILSLKKVIDEAKK